MLSELAREQESYSCLNFTRRQRLLLIVADKFGGFSGDLLKDVVDKAVHNGHAALGNTCLWVDLLKDAIDVHGISFSFILTERLLRVPLSRSVLCGFLRALSWRILLLDAEF